MWATTWEERAKIDLAPTLGFGADWPFISFDDDIRHKTTWKLPAAQRFADMLDNRDRTLAWIDDDLYPDALEWAARRTRDGTPTLMVRPDADVGITPRHSTASSRSTPTIPRPAIDRGRMQLARVRRADVSDGLLRPSNSM